MSSHYKFSDQSMKIENTSQGKVKLTDLLDRMNEERKIERKVLALSVAAVSAVTVFGIILTI